MKKNLLILSILLFVACDGGYYSEVFIIDAETNKPIENASIKGLDKYLNGYSDENGRFEASFTTGAPFGRTEVTVMISKKNYIADTMVLKNEEKQYVKMIKQKAK